MKQKSTASKFDRRQKWSRTAIILSFNRFANSQASRFGPTVKDLTENQTLPSHPTIVRFFGSLENATIKSGLSYQDPRLLTYRQIREDAMKRGYRLLGKVSSYKGNTTKLRFKCENRSHSSFKMAVNVFRRGGMCHSCRRQTTMSLRKDFARLPLHMGGNISSKNIPWASHLDFVFKRKTRIRVTKPKSSESSSFKESKFYVETKNLSAGSSIYIWNKCKKCKIEQLSRVRSLAVLQDCECTLSNRIAIGSSRQHKGKTELLEKKFAVTVIKKAIWSKPSLIKKSCGCTIEQRLINLRIHGPKECKCDTSAWRYLELIIRESIRGEKPRVKGVGELDCVTEEFALEIKGSIRALFSMRGRIPLEKCQKYLKWAQRTGRQFFVLVNDSELNFSGLRIPKFVLGWESWERVGIPRNVLRECKKVKYRPFQFARNRLKIHETKLLTRFVRYCIRIKRIPTDLEILKTFGVRYQKICRLAGADTQSVRRRDLAKLIGLNLPSN